MRTEDTLPTYVDVADVFLRARLLLFLTNGERRGRAPAVDSQCHDTFMIRYLGLVASGRTLCGK